MIINSILTIKTTNIYLVLGELKLKITLVSSPFDQDYILMWHGIVLGYISYMWITFIISEWVIYYYV